MAANASLRLAVLWVRFDLVDTARHDRLTTPNEILHTSRSQIRPRAQVCSARISKQSVITGSCGTRERQPQQILRNRGAARSVDGRSDWLADREHDSDASIHQRRFPPPLLDATGRTSDRLYETGTLCSLRCGSRQAGEGARGLQRNPVLLRTHSTHHREPRVWRCRGHRPCGDERGLSKYSPGSLETRSTQ